MLHVEQRKVLRELAVEEFGGVFTGYADHAELGQTGCAARGQGRRYWLGVDHG